MAVQQWILKPIHSKEDIIIDAVPLDVAGHRRSPATMPGYHRGRPDGKIKKQDKGYHPGDS
jgi:hypothetical protein